MRIVRNLAVFFIAVMISLSQSVLGQSSAYFNIQKVADAVYAAIAKPGVACNGAFIVTNDGVIVVDTHLRPSWAKDLIGAIGKITDQPVRYVVNTHWHGDHTQGNKAYEAAFPKGTEFISHHNTRDDIITKAIPSIKQSLDSLPVQIGRLKARLESGKRPDGGMMNDSMKAALKTQIENQEAYLGELKTLEITIPNLTFDRSLILWKGDRQIQFLYFGEAHTRGDVVIYLPKERILVTGDLLTGGMPFMRDAVPLAWGPTLEAVGKLDIEQVLPGHGEVQKGKDRLNIVVRYLNDLYPAVKAQVDKGASAEEATKAVADQFEPKHGKDFANFRQGLGGPLGNVTKTYEALKAKK